MKKQKAVLLEAFRYKFSKTPIAPGYYWFYGFVKGHLVKEFVSILGDGKPNPTLYVFGVEDSLFLDDFVGFWWGPVLAPWQQGSLYKRLECVEKELYLLEEEFNRAAIQGTTDE